MRARRVIAARQFLLLLRLSAPHPEIAGALLPRSNAPSDDETADSDPSSYFRDEVTFAASTLSMLTGVSRES